MIELEQLANQVLHNCYISDSRFAGNYSICGLAMRLRDLYKWENGFEPWLEKDFPDEYLLFKEKIEILGFTLDELKDSQLRFPRGQIY